MSDEILPVLPSNKVNFRLLLQVVVPRRKRNLIVKNDGIVWEWFAEGWHDTVRTHYTASMAKAVAGGMSLLHFVF